MSSDKTTHFLKAIGFTPEEIDFINKKAGKSANFLPARFMKQLEKNRHIKMHRKAKLRKFSSEDFTQVSREV